MRRAPDDIGNGQYGSSIKTLLERRGTTALGLGGDIQPVILLDDITRGHASTRRWLGGYITITGAAGQTGRVAISVQATSRSIFVCRPYVVNLSGGACTYKISGGTGLTLGGGTIAYIGDVDMRKYNGSTSTGIVRLDGDTGTTPALATLEAIRLHSDIQGNTTSFRHWYTIDESTQLYVWAETVATAYGVGVEGYLIQQ